MSMNLSGLPDDSLRELCRTSGQMLKSLSESLEARPDIQNSIRRLMSPDDMLETFSKLAVREPDLMRLVLQAGVAALVNVHSQRTAGHR